MLVVFVVIMIFCCVFGSLFVCLLLLLCFLVVMLLSKLEAGKNRKGGPKSGTPSGQDQRGSYACWLICLRQRWPSY